MPLRAPSAAVTHMDSILMEVAGSDGRFPEYVIRRRTTIGTLRGEKDGASLLEEQLRGIEEAQRRLGEEAAANMCLKCIRASLRAARAHGV